MITYHRVKTNAELEEILELQRQNLRQNLGEQEQVKEGFVSLEHSFKVLKEMNNACAHCIAKKNGKVVGFALSMLKNFKNDVPLLLPMFEKIEEVVKQGKFSSNYMVMGQICIAKTARSKGVFRGLYRYMEKEMKGQFEAIVTEVDTKNIRSSNAHRAVGFSLLKKYTSNNQLWEIIFLTI